MLCSFKMENPPRMKCSTTKESENWLKALCRHLRITFSFDSIWPVEPLSHYERKQLLSPKLTSCQVRFQIRHLLSVLIHWGFALRVRLPQSVLCVNIAPILQKNTLSFQLRHSLSGRLFGRGHFGWNQRQRLRFDSHLGLSSEYVCSVINAAIQQNTKLYIWWQNMESCCRKASWNSHLLLTSLIL